MILDLLLGMAATAQTRANTINPLIVLECLKKNYRATDPCPAIYTGLRYRIAPYQKHSHMDNIMCL